MLKLKLLSSAIQVKLNVVIIFWTVSQLIKNTKSHEEKTHISYKEKLGWERKDLKYTADTFLIPDMFCYLVKCSI